MPVAITTPRINNNDDFVRFSQILSPIGTAVKTGDPIAEIETDKATFTIEAEQDGYILGFVQKPGELIPVGSVLAWLGNSPDDSMPLQDTPTTATMAGREPTLKASILLAKFGISAEEVPASGDRLSAQEVLAYVKSQNGRQSVTGFSAPAEPDEVQLPLAPGNARPLVIAERAMLKTVLWQKQNAVTGYVEVEYDIREWEAYAYAYQQEHNMLVSPLLPLMAWRLTQLAKENPKINCTLIGDKCHEYSVVNLGMTVQADDRLSLLCVRDAGTLTAEAFVQRLNSLIRQGMRSKLSPEDTTEVTISFSSMARWQVTRHMPILPPFTSLIVAHTHARNGIAALGAAYDHRILTGGDAAVVLRSLCVPPKA